MAQPDSPFGRLIHAHGRTFAVSLALGAVVALGVRSMFVETGGSPHMAAASPPPAHHTEPGHEGHDHDGAALAPDEDEGEEQHEPATQSEADDRSHGGERGGERDGEHDGEQGDVPDEDPLPPDGAATETEPVGVLLDLGNESCPVMGGEVNATTFTEWNGLRVGHCCPGCNERFLKNPESLLDEVSPKWREAAAAAKAIDAAEPAQRKVLLAQATKRWRVLREPTVTAKPAPPPGLLVDIGNTECPVMGGAVNAETFTEWNGLRVAHCCPGCTQRFLKDPEGLLDEVSPNWREAVAAVERVNAAKGEARAAALAALRKRWRVVREPAPARAE